MGVPRLQHDDTAEWLDIGLAAGSEGGALYIAGIADSAWNELVIAGIEIRRQRAALPGVHGEFEQTFGAGSRKILWTGNLRVTGAALATIRAQIDALKQAAGTFTFIDDLDVEYASCSFVGAELGAKRKIVGDPTLEWIVPYRLQIDQLEP